MNTFLGELATFNDIQYAKYRLAFKLRKIQKSLLLEDMDISTLQEGLHLSSVESLARSVTIPTTQLISAIHELYTCLRLVRPVLSSAQVDQAQELCKNWMQMNYQCSTGGKVQVGSLKITLCLLTGAKVADKARYMFSVLANSNGSVETTDIAYFCSVAQELARTLQEDLFSNWKGPEQLWKECLLSVRSAADIKDDELDGGGIKRQWLSQFEFVKVFTTLPEPAFLSWWVLYHRMRSLEKVVHPIRCAVCTRKPIVSLRYQCTECHNFNLCQMCFLKGRITGKHLDSHQVVEICSSNKAQKSWRHRILGASVKEGRVWDEPKAPFVFNPRTSVSSLGSGGDQTDVSMNAITDMLVSSQQHRTSNGHQVDPTHKPTMIRIGSQGTSKSHVITQPKSLASKQVTVPSHGQLKRSSLSTNSSSSPDSASSTVGKFSYEGVWPGLSHTTSSSSCSDSLPSNLSSDLNVGKTKVTVGNQSAVLPQERTRSQSIQHQRIQQTQGEDLTEINRRLSLEVDMLLNDISFSSAPTPSVKPSISPLSHTHAISTNRPHLKPHRGYSLQHLKLEERTLEGHVSSLTNKREQLAGELEGLISQVQNLHTRSVSLSNGVRSTPSNVVGHTSPLVGPAHSRYDSLPTEAYAGHTSKSQSPVQNQSPIRGTSPLINRKISSPVRYQGPSGLYGSQELPGDHLPDPLSDYERPMELDWNPEIHRVSVAW